MKGFYYQQFLLKESKNLQVADVLGEREREGDGLPVALPLWLVRHVGNRDLGP
jgi:hypothetical protein